MCYRKLWADHHKKEIPEDHEIHHIDGNHSNNDIPNLQCVSIHEHLDIHYKQQDWGAVQAILMRIENYDKDLMKEAASKHQKELLVEKRHNWQINSEKRKINQSNMMQERIAETGNAFLGIENRLENSKHARSCMDKETELKLVEKMVAKIRGTAWWNNGTINKRSKLCPGPGWIVGMLPTVRKGCTSPQRGKKWWFNPITCEKIRSINKPNNEWKQGMK